MPRPSVSRAIARHPRSVILAMTATIALFWTLAFTLTPPGVSILLILGAVWLTFIVGGVVARWDRSTNQ